MIKELIRQNWPNAIAEIALSLLGTIGVVLLVATVVAAQSTSGNIAASFASYFDRGQVSLYILALAGIVFLSIQRHGFIGHITAICLYVFFLGPSFLAAVMIGLNPGFKSGALSSTNLFLLWVCYIVLHVVWLLTMLLQPVIPSAEEAAIVEDNRVKGIKGRAAGRA